MNRAGESELKKALASLALGKVKPLIKLNKDGKESKEINSGDRYHVNEDFRHKLVRVKINALQLKETPEEHSKTQQGIIVDRQYQVDAALVRIMKTRKSLSHQLLLSELFAQIRFPLKPVDAKKRIESLIEREYMKRDPADPQMYLYLA
jgi:cullin-4